MDIPKNKNNFYFLLCFSDVSGKFMLWSEANYKEVIPTHNFLPNPSLILCWTSNFSKVMFSFVKATVGKEKKY